MKFLTIAQFAIRVGVSKSLVKRWGKDGAIVPVEKIGRMNLYHPRDVARMKGRNTKPGPRANGKTK
jgi:predicted site-specific integrase-resolvase